jgi:large subunit ribosomal protein L33
MARRSEQRVVIRLRSTAGTGVTYWTTKNKANDRERLVLRKYDRVLRRHVEFKEDR